MNEPLLAQILRSTSPFSDEEIATVLTKFEHKTIPKKTRLLATGEVAQEVYLMLEGCMRLFYEKDGDDISAYFFTEGMFSGAYDSFISQRPSRHAIETLEPCTVLAIKKDALDALFITLPTMNDFVRKVLEERFVTLHELFTSYILDSPEERYLNLLTHRPELLQRVPQHQIATYLGITPVSLSRIRNRVTKR